jgi:hypothetical protein
MSQRFSLKFHKKHAIKNLEVFYGQVLNNFRFSEFCVTDFRHHKFPKILIGINMAKFQDFLFIFLRKSLIQNSEKRKLVKTRP